MKKLIISFALVGLLVTSTAFALSCEDVKTLTVALNLTPAQVQALYALVGSDCGTGPSSNNRNPNKDAEPDIRLLSAPKLELQYDSSRQESALVATAKAEIKAGKVAIELGNFSFGLRSVSCGAGTPSWRCDVPVGSESYILEDGREITKDSLSLSAKSKTTVTIKTTWRPSQMFAGVYETVGPKGATYSYAGQPANSWPFVYLKKFPEPSNRVTIVGERSPYVTSTEIPACNPGGKCMLKINGIRFVAVGNVVKIMNKDGVVGGSAVDQAADGSVYQSLIDPVSGLKYPDGYYVVQLSTHTGASNFFSFRIGNIVEPQPQPPVPVPMPPYPTPTPVPQPSDSIAPKIINISGDRSTYVPGSLIELRIKGVNPNNLPASQDLGYNVQSYIWNGEDLSAPYLPPNPPDSYNGVYDSNTKEWRVKMYAPSNLGLYTMRIVLYCSRDGSACRNAGDNGVENERNTKILRFSIAATSNPQPSTISIRSPHAGETWKLGEQRDIKWEDSATGGTYNIVLFNDTFGQVVGEYNLLGQTTDKKFRWVVGRMANGQNLANSSNNRIVVTKVGTNNYALSDYFNIVANNHSYLSGNGQMANVGDSLGTWLYGMFPRLFSY